MKLIFFSCIFAIVQRVEACAPYFRTPHFQNDLLPILNSSKGCNSPFVENGVQFIGSQHCQEIFVIRAFCKWKCETDCKMPNVSKINCPQPTLIGTGDRADQIKASCICMATGSEQKPCTTGVYTWSAVEDAHRQFCPSAYPVAGQALKSTGSITKMATLSITKSKYELMEPDHEEQSSTSTVSTASTVPTITTSTSKKNIIKATVKKRKPKHTEAPLKVITKEIPVRG